MNGEESLIVLRSCAKPAPMYTPMGPIRKAVSGIMMSMAKKGTKMSWTLDGMSFFRNLYSGPSSAAMSSGGKT